MKKKCEKTVKTEKISWKTFEFRKNLSGKTVEIKIIGGK